MAITFFDNENNVEILAEDEARKTLRKILDKLNNTLEVIKTLTSNSSYFNNDILNNFKKSIKNVTECSVEFELGSVFAGLKLHFEDISVRTQILLNDFNEYEDYDTEEEYEECENIIAALNTTKKVVKQFYNLSSNFSQSTYNFAKTPKVG
ncbi:MAG: hypothetical protein KIT27_11360 [Legionellales bacterium]|nr:hypothetical protein [Legionellales bacterium]